MRSFITGEAFSQENMNDCFAGTTDLTRTDGKLSQIDEKYGGVLRKRTTLTRIGGVLTSVNVKLYAANGTTVVMEYNIALNRTDGKLTSVTRTVI